MSVQHSMRPLLHVSVLLVIIAHSVLLATGRPGHHSLSHYQRESDIVSSRMLWLIGILEVQFFVENVLVLFSLTCKTKCGLLKFAQQGFVFFNFPPGVVCKVTRQYNLMRNNDNVFFEHYNL